MGEIVNLRSARKAKERATYEKQAEENRAKFGRRKADRERDSLLKKIIETKLDGHKID